MSSLGGAPRFLTRWCTLSRPRGEICGDDVAAEVRSEPQGSCASRGETGRGVSRSQRRTSRVGQAGSRSESRSWLKASVIEGCVNISSRSCDAEMPYRIARDTVLITSWAS